MQASNSYATKTFDMSLPQHHNIIMQLVCDAQNRVYQGDYERALDPLRAISQNQIIPQVESTLAGIYEKLGETNQANIHRQQAMTGKRYVKTTPKQEEKTFSGESTRKNGFFKGLPSCKRYALEESQPQFSQSNGIH